jgi:hypothetical protein
VAAVEIDRVPRNADEEAALLRTRPGAWEYLLFASILKRKMDRLEPKYRDHDLRYVRPQRNLDEAEAIAFLKQAFHEATATTQNVERVLNARTNEDAFGKPGEDGDPEKIDHLAGRVIHIYESWLDWAASVRGTGVPDEFEHALDLTSRFFDLPIEQMREFVQNTVETCDSLPGRLHAEEMGIEITMTLKVDIQDGLVDEFTAELDRLREVYGLD